MLEAELSLVDDASEEDEDVAEAPLLDDESPEEPEELSTTEALELDAELVCSSDESSDAELD